MSCKWISHRGESADAPENTLSAFKLSLERHTDGMECDVHLTADHYVVVSHDSDTGRMGNRRLIIADSTLEELKSVCVTGAHTAYPDETIPLFADTLQYVGPGRQYFVELKPGCPELVPAVKKILMNSALAPEQIVIITFDRELLALSKAQMPQYKTLLLTGFHIDAGIMHPTAPELIDDLAHLHADGVDIVCNENVIDQAYVSQIKNAGFIFAVWTVDHPGQAQRFIQMGVDYITSNRAACLRDLGSQQNLA